MTKRLTEKQKEEIVKSFQSGRAIDVLSEKYACTVPTIIRNLKKSLGDSEYKEFLNKEDLKKYKFSERESNSTLDHQSFIYKALSGIRTKIDDPLGKKRGSLGK